MTRRRRRRSTNVLMGILLLFLAIGSCATAAGLYKARRTLSFFDRAVEVDGMLVDWRCVGRSSDVRCYPVIRYVDPRGMSETFVEDHLSSPRPSFRIGTAVTVLLTMDERGAIGRVALKSYVNLWSLPVWLLVFGIGFAAPSLLLLRTLVPSKRAPKRRRKRIDASPEVQPSQGRSET